MFSLTGDSFRTDSTFQTTLSTFQTTLSVPKFSTVERTTTPTAKPLGVSCSCGKCRVEDPEDCTKYSECINNEYVSKQCDVGNLFSSALERCEMADDVECDQLSELCLKRDGFFADENDCSSYVQCYRGISYNKTCPKGLLYNPVKRTCDIKSNCGAKPVLPTSRSLEVDCDCDYCIMGDSEDCSKYYLCLEGVAYDETCSDGLLFNSETASCDYEGSATCASQSPQCITENGDFSVPGDCSSYHHCVGGVAYDKECAPGFHFSVSSRQCKEACEAGCDQSVECPATVELPLCLNQDDFLPNPEDCLTFFECSEGQPKLAECTNGEHFNALEKICQDPCAAMCDPDLDCSTNEEEPETPTPEPLSLCWTKDFLPKRRFCKYYYDCTRGGMRKKQKCPKGLHFNPSKRVCDLPQKSGCGEPSKDLPVPDLYYKCPCEACLVPSAHNCLEYFLCLNFTAYRMKCSDGLLFDKKQNTCNIANKVICDSLTTTTSTPYPTMEEKFTTATGHPYTTEAPQTTKSYTTSQPYTTTRQTYTTSTTREPYTTSTYTTKRPYTTSTSTTRDPYTTSPATKRPYTTLTTREPYTTSTTTKKPYKSTTKEPYITSTSTIKEPYTTSSATTNRRYTTSTTREPYVTSTSTTREPYTISSTTKRPYTTSTTREPYTTSTTTKKPYKSTTKEPYIRPYTSSTTTKKPHTTSSTTTSKPYTTSTTRDPYSTSTSTTREPYTTPSTTKSRPYTTTTREPYTSTTKEQYATSASTTRDPYTTSFTTASSSYTTLTSRKPYTASTFTTKEPYTTSTPTTKPHTTSTPTTKPHTTSTPTTKPHTTLSTTTSRPYTSTTREPYATSTSTTRGPYTTSTSTTSRPYTTSTSNSPYSMSTPTSSPYTPTTTRRPYSTSSRPYTTTSRPYMTSTTSKPKSTLSPTKSPVRCPEANGMFRNPKDCGSFIHCSNFMPYHKECPGGLHFSVKTQRCEYPCDAQCDKALPCISSSAAPPTTPSPLCSCRNCLRPNPESCTKFFECKDGQQTKRDCPKGQTFDSHQSRCDWAHRVDCQHSEICPKRNGLFPHKDDCNKFVHCSNGIPYTKICPPRLQFDPATLRCTFAPGPCGSGPTLNGTTGKSRPPVPGVPHWHCPSSFGYYRHEEKCNQYYHCSEGVSILKECPEGLYFNSKSGICDWPKDVNCRSSQSHLERQCRRFTEYLRCPYNRSYVASTPHCDMFYDCRTGKACAKRCPDGLYFNPETSMCDLPTNVKCRKSDGGNYSLKRFSEICRHGYKQKAVDPATNKCYYKCHHDKVRRYCCSGTRIYNEKRRRCERITKFYLPFE